jgi:hypothetical protein
MNLFLFPTILEIITDRQDYDALFLIPILQ